MENELIFVSIQTEGCSLFLKFYSQDDAM